MKILGIKYTRMLTKIQRGNFQFFNYELIISNYKELKHGFVNNLELKMQNK